MAATFTISPVTRISVRQDVQEVRCERSIECTSFLSALPEVDAPALGDPVGGLKTATYSDLRAFMVSDGCLRARGIREDDVVAILMPNGPEIALVLLCCMSQCVAAPLDPSIGEGELVDAMVQLTARHAIWLQQHKVYSNTIEAACEKAGCNGQPIVRAGTLAGLFSWAGTLAGRDGTLARAITAALPAGDADLDDTAMVLRTSGTTSKPKVVPLTRRGLFTGATCIGRGLGLKSSDCCLNVMPLTHIGGISCSLLSTLLTGGLVYCAPRFDPGSFLELCEVLRPQPTWYYAAPTIHKAIALHCKRLPEPPKHRLRLARSGAANLADADARELREQLKGCIVLPTYSMSECMPVAQPPEGYNLEKTGSVGVPIASSLRIADSAGAALPYGHDGEVCIRGPVVLRGYKENAKANAENFFKDADDGENWFRTGDVGHLDGEGFLFLTGRCKELIKRGGEQVSPYEVEEVLLAHPCVEIAVVFAVPNPFWGEEVAAAIVVKPGVQLAEAADQDPEEAMTRALTGEEAMPRALTRNLSRSLTRRVGDEAAFGLLPKDATRGAARPLLVSQQDLVDFTAERLVDHKVPRQVVFLSSGDDIPKTSTKKYKRVGLSDHLGLSAVDLVAQNALEGGDDVGVAQASVPPPVKPHKAVYGLRFFFAVWVVFMHIGNFGERINRLRDISVSMPGFFMLAGFMLAAATTRPIQDRWGFYKSRIIAAHPLYLLCVFICLPIYWIVCIGEGEDRLGGSGFAAICEQRELDKDENFGVLQRVGRQAYVILTVVAAQTAWPWGLEAARYFWVNPALWFSSAYYFSVYCFPFVHSWSKSPLFNPASDRTQRCCTCSRSRLFSCNPYCCRPMLTSTLLIIVGTKVAHWITKWAFYYSGWYETVDAAAWACWCFPPTWVPTFMLGLLTFNAFEFNRRGTSESEWWPFWGMLTDGITLMLLLICVLSVLNYTADRAFAMFFSAHSYHGGQGLEQGWHLCLGVLAVWFYGLAAGAGFTSQIMSSKYLVQYLSPASYAIYLFHHPVCYYWWLATRAWNDIGHSPEFLEDMEPWEFFAILLISICLAVFVTHVANEYVTSMFMRLFEHSVRVFSLRHCTGESGHEEMNEDSTLTVMVSLIKGLTGADVDGSTQIAECGFDSFGMGAMVALVRKNFPAAKISAMRLYQLQTIGELVAEIDCKGKGDVTDSDASSGVSSEG